MASIIMTGLNYSLASSTTCPDQSQTKDGSQHYTTRLSNVGFTGSDFKPLDILSLQHREGFWDTLIMGVVARKVMEIEERDYYEDINPLDDVFSLSNLPTSWDLSLPTLPESYRLREAEAIISGCPVDRVYLACKQKRRNRDQKVLIGEYDVLNRQWIYAGDRSPEDT
ncbi:hypothetical protein TSTA_094300 [Talaromyces stipitatus ATCC 10500]|uniref:Uncharacterized protein n=1 Tax=Talaromyces stipitatus (strain ATCC 10500 / CBS 375.48 / QM 6759 / NRRL 1006) TaxID=441959 RepID=B8M2S9_TALSN|nr:uncharacterized protein TSTA_094300 [Talaromyces stipitatus ATCC 10500]EED22184.1 hypothetical protein TSTA_094300 [Talaromyces stipitatus ATCC 10500]